MFFLRIITAKPMERRPKKTHCTAYPKCLNFSSAFSWISAFFNPESSGILFRHRTKGRAFLLESDVVFPAKLCSRSHVRFCQRAPFFIMFSCRFSCELGCACSNGPNPSVPGWAGQAGPGPARPKPAWLSWHGLAWSKAQATRPN